MNRYERPRVLASYAASELAREAAHCLDGYGPVLSDLRLKEEVAEVGKPIERLTTIRSR